MVSLENKKQTNTFSFITHFHYQGIWFSICRHFHSHLINSFFIFEYFNWSWWHTLLNSIYVHKVFSAHYQHRWMGYAVLSVSCTCKHTRCKIMVEGYLWTWGVCILPQQARHKSRANFAHITLWLQFLACCSVSRSNRDLSYNESVFHIMMMLLPRDFPSQNHWWVWNLFVYQHPVEKCICTWTQKHFCDLILRD